MQYKTITLNSDFNGNFYFTEYILPYDRIDNGEYVIDKITAMIYKDSIHENVWKNAILNGLIDNAQKEIVQIEEFIKKLKELTNE